MNKLRNKEGLKLLVSQGVIIKTTMIPLVVFQIVLMMYSPLLR
jgi:hypothetical protein